MRPLLLLTLALLPLAACDPRLGTMPPMGAGLPHRSDSDAAALDDAARQEAAQRRKDREIKQGEDVENEAARKAGFGPSATDGMNCTTTTSSSGSDNNRTTTSSTSCHN